MFHISYPPDTMAELDGKEVTVLALFGPTSGSNIETADLSRAKALIQESGGIARVVPFNAISVPAHPSGTYYAILAAQQSTGEMNDAKESALFRAAGRDADYKWGTSSGGDQFMFYQWSEPDAQSARRLGERLVPVIAGGSVSITNEPASFPHPRLTLA